MKKYIALLRGINVGGKNTIPMPELRLAFEEIGFSSVVTYINSGNVIFASDVTDERKLIEKCESKIKEKFGLSIPVAIISSEKLADVLQNTPDWWDCGDKETYNNAIFVIPPTSVEEVFSVIGAARSEYEKIDSYDNVIFWSASLKTFNKSQWSKIASSPMNNKVTIRNANTTRKLLIIAEK